MARKKLASLGFTVHHQGSGELLVAANEYVFSKCDLLVYHPGKCEMHVQPLHISVRQIDVLCISDDYQINKYDLSQAVAELKVENTTAETEKECFFNMFGEAVKLTLKSLASGKVIRSTTVYGIVAAAHHHEFVLLLILKINFEEGLCHFQRCSNNIPLKICLIECLAFWILKQFVRLVI